MNYQIKCSTAGQHSDVHMVTSKKLNFKLSVYIEALFFFSCMGKPVNYSGRRLEMTFTRAGLHWF